MKKEEIREGIENNYRLVSEMEESIDAETDPIRKLRLISVTGLLYAVLQTGVYSSAELEKKLCCIGKGINIPKYDVPRNGKILHVMTQAANYGGHTVLAANWIRWDSDHTSSVVLTDMLPEEIPDIISNAVKDSGGDCFTLHGDYIEKASQLCEISKCYQLVVLHMHMHDVVPVLAYSVDGWKTPVVFCNHADFRFSYGFVIADRITNLNHYDIEKNIRYRGVERERNECLFFPDRGNIGVVYINKDIRTKYDIPQDMKLIVSMGADYKYKSVLEWNFQEFVEKLLFSASDAVFVIIGADPNRREWVELYEKTGGKARALGVLSKEDATSIISEATLYVASFPMVASGAFIAKRFGVPFLTLRITGRGSEWDNGDTIWGVDELLKRSLEILSGKETERKRLDVEFSSKETWQKKWNAIIEKTKEHSSHDISPQRIVELQEYIDYEMMLMDAPGWIGGFLWRNRDDSKLYEKMCTLSDKYKINIIPNDHRNKWLRMLYTGEGISRFLINHGICSVSIYGMGMIGLLVWKKIKSEKIVEIMCGIDRNAEMIDFDAPIKRPEEFENSGEIVINTTTVSNEKIFESMNRTFMMLSIDELMKMDPQE